MTFLYQIDQTNPGNWRTAVCDSAEHLAAIIGVRIGGKGSHRVYVADNEPSNLHPNGNPKKVTPHLVEVV